MSSGMWRYITEYFEGLWCLQKHQETVTPHSITKSLIQHVTWMTSWTYDAERVILLSQTAVCPSRWKMRLYQLETIEPTLCSPHIFTMHFPVTVQKLPSIHGGPYQLNMKCLFPHLNSDCSVTFLFTFLAQNVQRNRKLSPSVHMYKCLISKTTGWVSLNFAVRFNTSDKFGSSSYSSTGRTQNISIWYSIYTYVTKLQYFYLKLFWEVKYLK
jgi:hypothetical protein